MKKVLCVVFCLFLVLSNCTIALAQTNDYENNWAKAEIESIKSKGIIVGYPDGTFRPNNNITKAEFYKIINKTMGFINESEVNFSDVIPEMWYYNDVAKGIEAKYIIPTGLLNANKNISRAEVAKILGIVFEIEGDELEASKFTDYESIPEDLKPVIGGLRKNGYINGYPDGSFRVNSEITRAEVVKMIHNISGEIVNQKSIVEKNAEKNMIVNTSDVSLKNIEVGGNLYLTEGIGEGNSYLENVKVKNMTVISGGGSNSIEIKNSELNSLLVNKKYSSVMLVLLNTKMESVKAINQAKLHLKSESFIKELELKDRAELIIDKGATIDKLIIKEGNIAISGQGTINYIKSEVDFISNGTKVKSNTEYKLVSGKLIELNPAPPSGGGGTYVPDPDPQPPIVNKAELIKAINEAKNKVEDDYTSESWEVFVQALQEAERVRDNQMADQAQVNIALNKLRNAMDNLVEKSPVISEPKIAAIYYPNYLNYFPYISIQVEGIEGVTKFSVEFYIFDSDGVTGVMVESNIFDIDKNSEAIFYNPEKFKTINIKVYDKDENLLYKFEGVEPKLKTDAPIAPEVVARYYKNSIIDNAAQIYIDVTNLEGANFYDIEYHTSDIDGIPNVDTTIKSAIDKPLYIWYDLASNYRTITIKIYKDEILLHVFENVIPIKGD